MEVTHIESEPGPETTPSTEHELGEHDAHLDAIDVRVEELATRIDSTHELIEEHATNHPEIVAPIDVVDHTVYVTKQELQECIADLETRLVPPAPEPVPEPSPPDEPPHSRESGGFGSKIKDWFYK